MNEKVYPMYESYDRAAAQLVELIEARDMLAGALKTMHPNRRPKARMMLADANRKIERCEAALAAEYESHQQACRARENLDAVMSDLEKSCEAVFIYIKHRHPENLEALKAALFNDWTEEEIEAFHDRIAVFEATRLEEFIGEAKSS